MGPLGVINLFSRNRCPNFVRGPPSRMYIDRILMISLHILSLESSGRLILEIFKAPSLGFFLSREYRGVTIGSFVTPVTPKHSHVFYRPYKLLYLFYRFYLWPHTYSHGAHRPSDPEPLGAFELACKRMAPLSAIYRFPWPPHSYSHGAPLAHICSALEGL